MNQVEKYRKEYFEENTPTSLRDIVTNVIIATSKSFQSWLESDEVVIRNKETGEVVNTHEIHFTGEAGAFTKNFLYPELAKYGITYTPKEQPTPDIFCNKDMD